MTDGFTRDEFVELHGRVSALEEHVDMLWTPFHRRLLFWLNGWPWSMKPVSASSQRWRPWHYWGGRRD